MKKKILCLSLILLIFQSCTEDFLEVNSVQDPTTEGLYKTDDGLEFGVIGLYDAFQTFYEFDKFPAILEQRSDNAQRGERPVQYNEAYFIDDYIYGEPSYWRNGYNLIKNSYIVDEYLDEYLQNKLTEIEKNNILSLKGEVAFLRGMTYFNLVRYFGRVPKVTKSLNANNLEEAYDLGLATVDEIYTDIIIPDLLFAIQNCKTKLEISTESKIGRATSEAASAALGDVYLTTGNFSGARDVLQILYNKIKSLGYNYSQLSDIFFDSRSKSEIAGENSSESIFEIQWSIEDGTSYYSWLPWDARDLVGGGKGVAQLVSPSATLISAYTFEKSINNPEQIINQNKRFEVAIDTSYSRPNTGNGDYFLGICLKYLEYNVPVERNVSWRNYIIYRYSDVTLMLAEAIYMSGGSINNAISFINEVRQAHGVQDEFNIEFWKKVKNPSGLKAEMGVTDQRTEKEAFIYGILHERRLEFAFEGKRYFDLKRTGKFIEFIKTKIVYGDPKRNVSEINQTLASGEQLLFRIPEDIIKENRQKYSN